MAKQVPISGSAAPHGERSPSRLVLLAMWFGLLAGIVEVGLRVVQKFGLDQRISLSHQFVWMAPLADLILYGLMGLLVAALLRNRPDRLGVGMLTFLAAFVFVAAPLYLFQRLHGAAVVLVALGLAYQAGRWAAGHADVLHRLARRTFLPLTAVVLVFALAVNGWLRLGERRMIAALPEAGADAPNVILVILDTVRSASLRLYGYERSTTPTVDRLASDAVVFDRAIATAPWTLPSHASMFTGRYPDVIDADWRVPMGADHPTLAEVLAQNGYLTGGFSGNVLYATYETGLARGFARFEDYPVSVGMVVSSSFPARLIAGRLKTALGLEARLVRRSGARVNRGLFDWLDANARRDRPFFAFVNYFDAHDPYLPPAPFDTLFGQSGPAPVLSFYEEWTPADLQRSQDAYDAAVAYVDHELGRLLDGLESRGLFDNTIVVVASDHGEHFGEHELLYHANSLYMPLLHVPLVIRRPGGGDGGRRIAEAVSLADLPMTILDLARLPDAALPGTSLLASRGDSVPGASRPVRSFVSRTINMAEWLPASRGDMASATVGSLHYIRNGDGEEELYDYVRDPAETHNLAKSSEAWSSMEQLRRLVSSSSSSEPALEHNTAIETVTRR